MLKSNSWYFLLLLAFLCALLLGQQNWIDCMLQGALRETQASGINLLSLLGWSELRELRFIAFPCVQAKTWFHIWFHHATSIFNPFDIFWHFFTQVDGLDFPMVVFSSFFIFDFSWTFRPGGAGLGFPTHSWHWLLTPQKSYGLRRILRLSWKGQYDEYGFGFQDVSGTFTIFILIFILIMFFTDDIATISYSMYSNIGNIVLIQSSFLLFSRTCCADTCCQMG